MWNFLTVFSDSNLSNLNHEIHLFKLRNVSLDLCLSDISHNILIRSLIGEFLMPVNSSSIQLMLKLPLLSHSWKLHTILFSFSLTKFVALSHPRFFFVLSFFFDFLSDRESSTMVINLNWIANSELLKRGDFFASFHNHVHERNKNSRNSRLATAHEKERKKCTKKAVLIP